jgi:hypothetical protein
LLSVFNYSIIQMIFQLIYHTILLLNFCFKHLDSFGHTVVINYKLANVLWNLASQKELWILPRNAWLREVMLDVGRAEHVWYKRYSSIIMLKTAIFSNELMSLLLIKNMLYVEVKNFCPHFSKHTDRFESLMFVMI